jgi:heptosyltransferase I
MHFGQLGDVVLALPALAAIRHRFDHAKITLLAGKSAADAVRPASIADEIITVDRVKFRDGNKIVSIKEIFQLLFDIRGRKFDLVIDLHSLPETNILGFAAGIPQRLYADRGNRSINRLSNFPSKPPAEDRTLHLADSYMRSLRPIGVSGVAEPFKYPRSAEDTVHFRSELFAGVDNTTPAAALFPGAGNPSRCWPLERFAELAEGLTSRGVIPFVFLGPEEVAMRQSVDDLFTKECRIVEGLTLVELITALSIFDVVVGNDTGPMHLAACAGAAVVLILDERAPKTYLPLTDEITVVSGGQIHEIATSDVLTAAAAFVLAKTGAK